MSRELPVRSISTPVSATRLAWFIVAVLWPVALLNYLDRQMLSAMKFSVMADIPSIASDAHWGYMLGQFKWVYAFLSPIGGYMADRFSRRWTVCGSLFVWSAVTWATGQVTTYDGLLWTRTLMGISEAFYIPAALSLIADYHSPATRSRAVAVHQMAIYSGMLIGGFSGYVADAPTLGWRFAFDFTGLAGMIYAVPLLLWLRDAPKTAAAPVAAPLDSSHAAHSTTTPDSSSENQPAYRLTVFSALRELATNGSFILLVLYFTIPALAGWVVRDWMPAILKDRFQIGQGMAGVSASLYLNIASFGGVVLGGYWADRWSRHSIRGRIYVSAIGMSLIIPALFGVGNAGSLFTAVAFLTLFGAAWGIFDCNNMPILSQIVRPELRATGYGLMNCFSISCGGFADVGFGMLRDRNVPINLIFTAFAATALLSVVLVLLIRPRKIDGDQNVIAHH